MMMKILVCKYQNVSMSYENICEVHNTYASDYENWMRHLASQERTIDPQMTGKMTAERDYQDY
jgi:hypothetical protein